MSGPPLKLPPVLIHDRITIAEMGERVPWSVEPAIKLGDRTARGLGVGIGSIDTGIDRQHEESGDLCGQIHGMQDFTGSRFGAFDMQGHGTHTIGTMLALSGNEMGVESVAPAAHCFVAKGLGDDGAGYDSQIVEAINWLVECKVQIINMSLGGPAKSNPILAAIERALASGITIVCAAGNEGDHAESWPAMHPGVVSVGAVDKRGKPATFSSPSSVDVAAPGVEILSTYRNGQYGVLSGTSMAAPWVSAFLAIWFAEFHAMHNSYPSPQRALDQIKLWTTDIGAPRKTGAGLVNADKYLAEKERQEIPKPAQRDLISLLPWRYEVWRRRA